MATRFRREGPALFAGDIFFLVLALWATLFVRYGTPPATEIFVQHLVPFSFLFALSALVFFISGLYEKHTLMFKLQLPQIVLYAQIANAAVGAIFFFMVPYFGIQPKTNLFIYLVLSTALVSLWRMFLFPLFAVSPRTTAVLVGEGEECAHIYSEVNGNNRYPFRFSAFINREAVPAAALREHILSEVDSGASMIVLPFSYLEDGSILPEWGMLMFEGIRFVDAATLYEDLFDRVGLSFLDQRWFLEESARARTALYGILKRIMDVILAAIALVILSPLLALMALILKAGGGPAFIAQERVGRGGKPIKIIKLRSMLFDDGGDPERQKMNRITKVGAFLRKTQIDEFPQFWNVVRGDLSLVGPRPEIPSLVRAYEADIPFYSARHLIQPGISGWAQIKHASPPKFKVDIEGTRHKLSYDLYYLKHHSLLLDFAIALQTVKILFARAGR